MNVAMGHRRVDALIGVDRGFDRRAGARNRERQHNGQNNKSRKPGHAFHGAADASGDEGALR